MSDTKTNTEWSDREIGALWTNVNPRTNDKYLTGHINGEKVILFKNKYKSENEKAPDLKVYKQKDADSNEVKPKDIEEEDELI